MGHQESSPPPQRQRVPHHRHHHRYRHGHNHYATARTANNEPALTLGRLNRASHAPDNHVVVESWLGQVTAPVPATRIRSPESRNQPVCHGKRPRSKDRQAHSWRQHARRVDPLWRPQHIPPPQGSSPPRLPLPTRNPKRYKRDSDDSSLISDISPPRRSRKRSYVQPTPQQAENSRHKPLDEAGVGTGASSPTSHIGAVPAFEKRPRHKTRADKYETKKSEDRKKRGGKPDQGEDLPGKSKSRKRKHLATGKNVMNNFTSEVILNDRITVQTNLKPGLFSNKRVSKNNPITDLSFSEMPFPTNQERDAHKQKGLSSSRLREVQRENRELEQISSFFLPTCADPTPRKVRQVKSTGKKRARCKSTASRDDATSLTTPSSPTAMTKSCSIPTITPSKHDCRSGSTRATTYFTWSTSQNSPEARKFLSVARRKAIERAASATPDNIRKALVATGVYRDTGIRLHDASDNQQKYNIKETCRESSSACSNIVDHVDTYEEVLAVDQESRVNKSKSSNNTTRTMASLGELEERWNAILPPEWRLRRSPIAEASSICKQQQGGTSDIPTSVGFHTRSEIVREALIKPVRESPRTQHIDHHGYDPGTSLCAAAEICVPVPSKQGQTVDQARHTGQDRDTINSRDAMPPPPLPLPRFNSPQSNNHKPGDDLSSLMHSKTTRSPETHAQVSNCEHARVTNTYERVSQLHEASRTPEKVIPTLDSASWIPQAITSGIASNEREKTLSRLSMRSSIYDIRGKGEGVQEVLQPTPPHTTLVGESMADFIARIESEVEESTSLDECYQTEPATRYQESQLDSITSTSETHGDASWIAHRQLPHDLIDAEFEEAFETRHYFYGCEELGASIPIPMEAPRASVDEFEEMSKFWRPNPFSYI
ncbi:hypothetical protein GGR51DRAFT_529586 [Nemania sp. FL0031]|nr:hypothetical protein GGR51DRAFT_529586 [Nemania sp. FL0031]